MKVGKTSLILLIAVPVVLASLGAAVYFFWDSLQAQHEANNQVLEKFGFEIMPVSPYTESKGVLGQKQVPATFAEDELTPVEKVIHGLLQDRDQLLEENTALEQKVAELEEQIAALEQYKALNEQFAPETLEQEMTRTHEELKQLLRDLPEASRYSNFWIEIMATAALNEYRRFIDANRLMLDSSSRAQLIREDLVTYGFCVGNAIELAANSADEARMIARWFDDPSSTRLSDALKADLEIVLPPCRIPLRQKLSAKLASSAAG